ncbi:MAG: LPXTG cell wall anchor domain-containing protein, partial [Firmicutes bacterium]|nr:LPXTG cell wall anchor domain-containing protein [Bacillota bacterium]
APAGYNALKETINITVTGENSTTQLIATSQTVENYSGTELPETGGIGTTIFYLIGAILVIGAGVVFVTRRRMHSDK